RINILVRWDAAEEYDANSVGMTLYDGARVANEWFGESHFAGVDGYSGPLREAVDGDSLVKREQAFARRDHEASLEVGRGPAERLGIGLLPTEIEVADEGVYRAERRSFARAQLFGQGERRLGPQHEPRPHAREVRGREDGSHGRDPAGARELRRALHARRELRVRAGVSHQAFDGAMEL